MYSSVNSDVRCEYTLRNHSDRVTNLEEFFGSPVVGFHVVVDLSITHWSVCLVNPNFLDLKSSTRISVKVGGSINTVHIGDCIHLKRKRGD